VPSLRRKKIGDERLPVITCFSCGKEIVLIPNVELMGKAIEEHVETHKEKVKDRRIVEEETERIRDDLIRQVLEKVAKN
jgi:DNA-directed RNA polymerase subunit N (RpoN/RPB10)